MIAPRHATPHGSPLRGHPRSVAVARVRDLVVAAAPRCGRTVVVAVDGHSGAGKTTFAHALTPTLDGAALVHLEDLYPGWDGLAAGVRRLHDEVLQPLARGEHPSYRLFDWETGELGDQIVAVPAAEVLVVEGVGASCPPADHLVSVRVWLEADAATRRARALERDGETYRPHWDRWAAQERDLFARHDPRGHADILVNTA